MAKKNIPAVSIDPRAVNYTGYVFSPHADRPALFHHVLQWDKNPFLYTLPRDMDYLDLVVGIVEEHFANDTQVQGKLDALLNQKKVQASEVGRTLAEILSGFQTIILDDIDRLVVTDQAIEFMDMFVDQLSNEEKILVANGRTANLDLWADLRARQLVVIIDEQGEDVYYNRELPLVEIKLFGNPSVSINGKEVSDFGGPLPNNLTYYFGTFSLRTRDEIFWTFWPKLSIREATNVFHVTKRKISETLGTEITEYKGGFYQPSRDISIVNDVQLFEAAFKTGAWRSCVDLYRTGFLNPVEADMDWMDEKRHEYELNYLEALINLARREEDAGKFDEALSYYLETLPVQVREDAVRSAMSLYHKLNQDEKAIELYRNLEVRLSRTKVQGRPLTPDPKTVQLYRRIAKL